MFLGKKKKESDNKVFIITNGADQSVEFIEQIRDKHNCHEDVLVFTGSYKYVDSYKKFSNVKVTTSSTDVYEFVNNI